MVEIVYNYNIDKRRDTFCSTRGSVECVTDINIFEDRVCQWPLYFPFSLPHKPNTSHNYTIFF